MILQNLHTHTTFCDGSDTPEEMTRAAIKWGMDSLGFSGHSPLPWIEGSWASMDVSAYRYRISRLREKYTGQLEIFLGIEQDADSPAQDGPWDYVIGSVHQVWVNKMPVYVDASAEILRKAVQTYFGGDPYSLSKAYYRRLVEDLPACQIVGHFDLITKFNELDPLFQEEDPRYRNPALEALDALTGKGLVFEINTGAMARACRTTPYPSAFLLQFLQERGERICISSDCHDARLLLYAFPQAAKLAITCGFREMWVLTKKGFIPQSLDEALSAYPAGCCSCSSRGISGL